MAKLIPLTLTLKKALSVASSKKLEDLVYDNFYTLSQDVLEHKDPKSFYSQISTSNFLEEHEINLTSVNEGKKLARYLDSRVNLPEKTTDLRKYIRVTNFEYEKLKEYHRGIKNEA